MTWQALKIQSQMTFDLPVSKSPKKMLDLSQVATHQIPGNGSVNISFCKNWK